MSICIDMTSKHICKKFIPAQQSMDTLVFMQNSIINKDVGIVILFVSGAKEVAHAIELVAQHSDDVRWDSLGEGICVCSSAD